MAHTKQRRASELNRLRRWRVKPKPTPHIRELLPAVLAEIEARRKPA